MIFYTKRKFNLITVIISILIYFLIFFIINQYPIKSVQRNNLQSNNFITQNSLTQFLNSNNNTYFHSIYSESFQYLKYISENKPIIQFPIMQLNTNQKNNITDKTQTEKQTQREVVNQNKESSWRIQIPKINLNVHIQEGTDASVLIQAVGHFPETSTWNGNIVLAAHNRGYNCNFFQKIKYLQNGDTIIYETQKGKRKYKVIMNKIILETDWSSVESTKDNRITLITCEENRREYRRCIQAIEVDY